MAFLDWKWGCNITFSKAKKVSGTTGFLDSQPCHFWRQHCYFWVFSRNPWSFWCSQGSRLSYKDVLDLQGKVMICHLKPAWLSFYCGTQTKIFWIFFVCTMEMKGVGFVLNPIKYHCMNKNWCERSITVFPLQSGRWWYEAGGAEEIIYL